MFDGLDLRLGLGIEGYGLDLEASGFVNIPDIGLT